MQKIKTAQFEGPLDLLLSLIEKEKLDICKISLARITNSYLEEIQKIDATNESLVDFLIVASKLLYLKSQAVLPVLAPEEEEEIQDLEEQLKEYKKYKKLSEKFAEIINQNQRSFEPGVRNFKTNIFLPPIGVDLEYLMTVFQEAINRMPKKAKTEEKKIDIKVTLEEKLKHLNTLIKTKKKLSFANIISSSRSKGETIVTFLALLEMIKRKTIKVSQSKNFGDLVVQGI